MKMMTESKTVHFNGKESNVRELTTQEIQTLLERINHDAHQVLEERFRQWAESKGLTLKKQNKNDDRTFLAVLPDLGGMAVISVSFIARNACKNWLVYGSSIKESIGPDEDHDDWAEPDFSIRAVGYKLTSKGTPSLQESEKCETYLNYWSGDAAGRMNNTVFESPVQKDIREREAEMVKVREDMQIRWENKRREIVQKAFGVGVTEAWDEFNEEAKTSLVESAKKVISENPEAFEAARIKAERRADEQSTVA